MFFYGFGMISVLFECFFIVFPLFFVRIVISFSFFFFAFPGTLMFLSDVLKVGFQSLMFSADILKT